MLLLCVRPCDGAFKDLTFATFEEETAGKGSIVLFYAPWCGHCKELLPEWAKLEPTFKDDEDVLVGKVDCIEEANKDLCVEMHIKSFPTIRYFTHETSEVGKAHSGRRKADAITTFIKKKLIPECGLKHVHKCTPHEMEDLMEFKSMTDDERELEKEIIHDEIEIAKLQYKVDDDKVKNQYKRDLSIVPQNATRLFHHASVLLRDIHDEEMKELHLRHGLLLSVVRHYKHLREEAVYDHSGRTEL